MNEVPKQTLPEKTMKKILWVCLLSWMLVLPVLANEEAAADVAKSLEQMAVEAQATLTQANVLDIFDWYRKLKEHGMTYQPSLAAPNDLVEKLDEEQLRFYAGVKLFDALYAATFLKRQEVLDCVAVIEEIQEKLDLRSYADLNNYFLKTLKALADDPAAVDIQVLIGQLASDYVNELPQLLSSAETADYLIDGLYGTILQQFITSGMIGTYAGDSIEEGFELYPSQQFFQTLLRLFEAFDRMDESIRVSGETVEKVDLVRELCRVDELDEADAISVEESGMLWEALMRRALLIRSAYLTPGAMGN